MNDDSEFSTQSFIPVPDGMVDSVPLPDKEPPLVLVVEDEGLIRMMVTETLADAGFRVSEAATGKQALQAVSAPEDLDAVILDVGLPDANGEELIDKIRELKPGIPIIMTTGYDTNSLRKRAATDPNLRILMKPYQPDLLAAFLKEWNLLP